jgi:hypothetical protein
MMTMNKTLFMLLSGLLLFCSCSKKPAEPLASVLKMEGISAVGPYLTKDNKGNPVLCWTEQDAKDSLYRLKYAVYNRKTEAFNAVVTVAASAGSSTSAESMGKIAFKADGMVMAVFAKRFPKEKNPYAGAIYYSFSADDGKNWSKAQFLHSDTSHAYGRSFFDVSTLKDGELAAIWLDGRYGKSIKGSALFFSRTEKGKGFGLDTCLDKGTCECCRTDILCDQSGNIHLAYRSIQFPSALSGKQVRDMVYKISTDNGKTFSAAKTISKDNWEIEGCPHSGPSLAESKNGINALWFTAGGHPGLYFTTAPQGADFRGRQLMTAQGRHPQMVALTDGRLAAVCEESTGGAENAMQHMNHSGGKMSMAMMPAAPAKIVLRILGGPVVLPSENVSNGQYADHHAVLSDLDKDVLVAWIRDSHGRSEICYSKININ